MAQEIVSRLTRALPLHHHVVCPLGLGNHVDHRLTRLIAERLNRPVWYYEDFPYVLEEAEKTEQLKEAGWKHKVCPVSEAGLKAWEAAAAAYASQVGAFWGSEREMRGSIRNHLARVAGVRLWWKEKRS